MAVDRFAFYAQNYRDIGHLVKLDENVRETYPLQLWGSLQGTFTDALHVDSFAGLSDWECVDQEHVPYDGFSFWNRDHYDSEHERGIHFYIGELSGAAQRVESIERQVLAPLVTCFLAFDGTKGPGGLTQKKLVDAVRRAAVKLKKAGFKEIEGDPEVKGCYVRIDVGDLLHISTLGKQQQNFAELIKRVEKLVRACIPVIERAAQK